MLYRILTGVAALLVAALAIALPIVLTEAGTSTSTSDGRTLNASFEYVDPSTGDEYYGNIYASLSVYTQNTNDPGGGGSGGSGRAKSGRAGGGNSQKPSGGGGGGSTFISNDISLYIERYTAGGAVYGDGYTNSGDIIIAGDLSSGRVRATVPFAFYTEAAGYQETTVEVDLTFAATGALVTSRERYSSHVKSPRQSLSYMTTTSRRTASATGQFVVGDGFTGGGDIDLGAGGAYYAEIATYESKSRSSY